MDRIGAVKRGEQEADPDWGIVPIDSTLELRGRFAKPGSGDDDDVELPERSPDVLADNPVPKPPFLGTQVVKGIPIDDVAASINETALDRTRVGEGKSVSVRVDRGGPRSSHTQK